MHVIWKKIRSPFHVICCAKHTWEVYDVQQAGCLICGAEHKCENHLPNNKCLLSETDEGGLCCTITGYCIPTLRLSDQEYVDNVFFSLPSKSLCSIPITLDEIENIVQWFLLGSQSTKCKGEEVSKTIHRYQCALIKNLKQHKFQKNYQTTRRGTCILTAIAQSLHQVKPKYVKRASSELCVFCSANIFKCLKNLDLINMQGKKINLVVGMLFLMKQGLVIQNIQWLPKVTGLCHCLPHETSLEKNFRLCMKLVCETENEIKLALRQRVRLT